MTKALVLMVALAGFLGCGGAAPPDAPAAEEKGATLLSFPVGGVNCILPSGLCCAMTRQLCSAFDGRVIGGCTLAPPAQRPPPQSPTASVQAQSPTSACTVLNENCPQDPFDGGFTCDPRSGTASCAGSQTALFDRACQMLGGSVGSSSSGATCQFPTTR